MKPFYIISPDDLRDIAEAAYKYAKYVTSDIKTNRFYHLLRSADNLRIAIDNVIWDKDTELFIDELPF